MNRAVELLSNLVAIPSLSGREEHACAFLADALPAAGWERVEIDGAGSVVASRGSGSRELVLLGHIDTVPGGPVHALDGDILRGRGSVDAKGPLCAFAVAGGRALIAPDWKITLVAATGGRCLPARVTGPVGEPVDAFFGLLFDSRVDAEIERHRFFHGYHLGFIVTHFTLFYNSTH